MQKLVFTKSHDLNNVSIAKQAGRDHPGNRRDHLGTQVSSFWPYQQGLLPPYEAHRRGRCAPRIRD